MTFLIPEFCTSKDVSSSKRWPFLNKTFPSFFRIRYLSGSVDGEFKPPNSVLKNGQRIVIEKSDIAKPDPSWLNFVTSVKARTSIRNYLSSIHQSDALMLGEKLLIAS